MTILTNVRKKIKEELQKQIKDLDEEIKENAIESVKFILLIQD